MKANLFLVVSKKMDTNRKKGRNEDGLIRLGQRSREMLGLNGETAVELWPASTDTSDRINRSRILTIYEAYSEDLKKLKESNISDEDYARAGFVTTKTFNYICKRDDVNISERSSIWLADSIEDTVVGGDPEFVLIGKDGRIKYAAQIGGLSHSASLGSDGPLVEIRPAPAMCVDEFITNISDILNEHPNVGLIEDFDWIGGTYFHEEDTNGSKRYWTIGGHIHIGTPLKLYNTAMAKRSSNPTSALIGVFAVLKKVLDELVSVPMMRVEGIKNSVQRRQTSHYGGIRDMRLKYGRLELRTLSGAWLTHPVLAKAVVGTVKAITHSFFGILDGNESDKSILIGGDTDIIDWFGDSIPGIKLDQLDCLRELGAMDRWSTLHRALHEGVSSFNKQYFLNLRKKLKRLPTYREYAKYIDKFLAITKLPEDILEKQSNDLRPGWVNKSKYIIN